MFSISQYEYEFFSRHTAMIARRDILITSATNRVCLTGGPFIWKLPQLNAARRDWVFERVVYVHCVRMNGLTKQYSFPPIATLRFSLTVNCQLTRNTTSRFAGQWPGLCYCVNAELKVIKI